MIVDLLIQASDPKTLPCVFPEGMEEHCILLFDLENLLASIIVNIFQAVYGVFVGSSK